jgi:hypothetical protein
MSLTTATTAVQAPVEGTTQTQATPAAEPAAKPPEKDQFSEKLELLTRKERALWRQRSEIDQKAKQLSEYEAKIKSFEEKRSRAKTNPLDFLSEAGLSYDELTNYVLNGGKPTEKDELRSVRDEIQRLREERDKDKEESKTQAQQAQAQAEANAIEGFKEEITEFIEQNKTTYELSSMRDATEDIFTTINDAFTISMNDYNQRGRIGRPPVPMSIKDAADIVEDFYEKEVLRLTESQKLKAKLQPQPKTDEQQRRGPSPTLTNNMASTAASVLPAKNDQDRMQRALAKLAGE